MANKAHKNRKQQQNIIHLDEQRNIKRNRKTQVAIIPKNTAQETYCDMLNNDGNRLVFAVGPAGTGKTLLATLKSIKDLMDGKIERIIITRPAVGAAGENHGYLPGSLTDKMEPWVLPVLDIFHEYWTPKEVECMILDGVIEIAPFMYMRGRTFKNSCILLDEAQNTTPEQMKLILTRLGENTRIFITGDLEQTDHKKANGLEDITDRLERNNSKHIGICKFSVDHVERDPIIQDILNIYSD